MRIAAWSGPRNISTAMMRAWENRPDATVVDEPFYAFYLDRTGLDHPGREEVIAAGETDWRKVVDSLTGPIPGGRAVFYQKHMTHHLLPEVETGWFTRVAHAFLIRDPREVLLSYVKSRPTVTADDIGVPRQLWIHDKVCELTGEEPVVIDAGEFLKAPEAHLRAWCGRLGLDFTDRMLSWPPGPRDTDGVWAPYWYDAVLKSTGFEPYRERDRRVPPEHQAVIDVCLPLYGQMFERRLRVFQAGLAHEATCTVTPDMRPPHIEGILSTSRMIALMEDTCLAAVQPFLDAGQTTVGTRVEVSHVGTARAGEPVTIRVRLTKITQRRLLSFEVEAEAPAGVISTGTHQRLIVDRSKFA